MANIFQKYIDKRVGEVIKSLDSDLSEMGSGAMLASFSGGDPTYFYPLNFGLGESQNVLNAWGQQEAFNRCPSLNSIISKKVYASLNGINYFLPNIQEKKINEVNNPFAKYLKALLKNPNPLQNWSQFSAQAKIYFQTSGISYVLPVYPAGMEGRKDRIQALWNVPPWMVNAILTNRLFQQTELKNIISGYTIGNTADAEIISPDQIIVIRDIFVSSARFPLEESRMVALADPINSTIKAYEALNVLTSRKGMAAGIISNVPTDSAGTMPIKKEERERIENTFTRYGLSKATQQIIYTNANLKWTPMNYSIKELMVFEQIVANTKQIAEGYNYPFELLSYSEKKSMFDSSEKYIAIQRDLYENTIIPETNIFNESFFGYFETQKYGGFDVFTFYDHLSFFQKSILDKSQALYQFNQAMQLSFMNKIITQEEWRRELTEFIGIEEATYGSTYFIETNNTSEEINETDKDLDNE